MREAAPARTPGRPVSRKLTLWVGEAGRGGPALRQESLMSLRILDDIVQTVGIVHRLCLVVARQDPDLSRQMKRAINSVGLNAGEGISTTSKC